jgi:Ca2+-binding RTX toxin-like protein
MAAMATIYNRSPLAAKAIDDWLASNPTLNIRIKFEPDAALAYPNTGEVEIDPAFFEDAYYISTKGNVVMDSFVSGLAHELGHALTGLRDDDSFTNLAGSNILRVNPWFVQLGIEEQASYNAYDKGPSYIEIGKAYTEGRTIANAIIDNAAGSYSHGPFYMNTTELNLLASGVVGSTLIIGSSRDNVYVGNTDTDWFYGNDGKDLLRGGDGDDFLYGGSDDDTLEGGGGSNFIAGGEGHDKAVYDFNGAGAVLTLSPGSGGPDPAAKVQLLVKHGEDTDTLVDIEEVRLTAYSDRLSLTGDPGSSTPRIS